MAEGEDVVKSNFGLINGSFEDRDHTTQILFGEEKKEAKMQSFEVFQVILD